MKNQQEQNIKDLEPEESFTREEMPENIQEIQEQMEAEGKTLNWTTSFDSNEPKSVTFFLY
jgi:predicted RNA-binding protein with EMAP domain